ncbi:MAG TPA: hypothetical protein ENI23_14175, partial [bacterium]|nr:hypothetical protein [bacterium]
MDTIIKWLIFIVVLSVVAYADLETQNLLSVVNPFTGTGDIVRSTNQTGSEWIFDNITVNDRFIQNDYYIKPCENNSFIKGNPFCIWANSTTPLDVPYVNFQPGGAEQASYIAGSFMLVNRNQTNLLNVNRTSCKIQANRSGVELKIDCNSTSPANP